MGCGGCAFRAFLPSDMQQHFKEQPACRAEGVTCLVCNKTNVLQ